MLASVSLYDSLGNIAHVSSTVANSPPVLLVNQHLKHTAHRHTPSGTSAQLGYTVAFCVNVGSRWKIQNMRQIKNKESEHNPEKK